MDEEIRRILDEQYQVAYRLIDENHDKMHAMVEALMKWETIDREQFLQIMAGEEPREPKEYQHEVPEVNRVVLTKTDDELPPPLPTA